MSTKPPKKISKTALSVYLGLFTVLAVGGVTLKENGNLAFALFIGAIGVLVALIMHMQRLDQQSHKKAKKS